MCCGVMMVDRIYMGTPVTRDLHIMYDRRLRKMQDASTTFNQKSHLLYRLNVNKIDMAQQSQSCSHHTRHGSV
jgi:hypothetical protein